MTHKEMPAAGYSKRPLVEKLGIKQGARAVVLNAPDGYAKWLGRLPKNTVLQNELRGPSDFIHLFVRGAEELETRFPVAKQGLEQDGMLWVSWPKGSSKVKTDLNENIVREIGLKNGMVDIKVCAVDETWSGLKFVYRVKDRR